MATNTVPGAVATGSLRLRQCPKTRSLPLPVLYFGALSLVLLLIALSATVSAHDPKRKNRKPTKAAPMLKRAREKMDAAKAKMKEAGKYDCCVKPSCDLCARIAGGCQCAQHAAQGHGAFEGIALEEVKLEEMDAKMPSSFGVGTMFRQGSGTGWQPETTPMFAFMNYFGSWIVMAHATAFSTYTHQPGKLGDQKFFSTNWMMVSAQREVRGITKAGPGTFLVRGMFSLDPLTVGGEGYPLLLQTGETYKGAELTNRQHPHDFLMELAVAYSAPITEKTAVSVYFAPVGEPALGPTAFAHRLSAADNLEAPLGHHWQDSTHISAGVVTVGLAREKWKIEGSLFSGREPDEDRWKIDPLRFDSWSTRISVNPLRDWSFQFSYGSMRSPEAIQPYVDLRRVTASASHHRLIGDRSFWATSFIWGRNLKNERGYAGYSVDSYLIESAHSFGGRRNLFGRYEYVEKDNLFPGVHVHGSFAEIFPVQRFTLGGVQVLPLPGPFEWGIGGAFSFNFIPPATSFIFGEPLRSGSVFLRVRPKRWGAKE